MYICYMSIGRLYALGGFDGFLLSSSVESIALPAGQGGWGDGGAGGGQLRQAWGGGEWVKGVDMLETRSGFGACVVGGRVWVAGGNKGFQVRGWRVAYGVRTRVCTRTRVWTRALYVCLICLPYMSA